MNIKTDTKGKVTFIKLLGKFNIERVLEFEKTFNDQIKKDISTIIIDMARLNYIDSSGIGSIIKSSNILKNIGIELILIDAAADIVRIFKLAHLDKFFTITTGEEIKKRFQNTRA